ncbi:MAG: excinuclease ABC subunit UvrC [Bacteroidota bacterium]|jgi:excinuclease ABC subunit C|nr:excinuclease ABC subunit UvrC [Bacteroidota bacterium]NLP19528.1 excinuclease ABC subunit C [Bacteroidales bacterium]OQC46327.1 MAG: UvrABC system protein C [Bacteroidetes bacterium ADurb.Bin028]HOD89228.1 excinuclease ABC subunit UvrC [Bacteroidales bacterium]
MISKDDLDIKVKALPQNPGVYKYLDKAGNIIYVGKAKNLKKRVSSYFAKNHQSFKTNVLVKRIKDIEYIVTETENDALLLENVLIKSLQPRYNVMLKDDKTYPWICIKNETFPRVFYTRQKTKGNEYFGPFTSVYTIKTLLNLITQLYPIRNCNLNLSKEKVKEGKYKVCLEYHIGNCKAPCIGEIDEKTYLQLISDIRKILKGNLHQVQTYFTKEMKNHADKLEFEKAAEIKSKLSIIENYKSKSTIVNTNISDTEAFGFAKDINSAYVSYIRIQSGTIISAHSVEIRKKIDESDEDMLLFAVLELRESLNSDAKTTLLPFEVDFEVENTKIEVPKRGDKLSVIELANRNAKFFMLEKHKQIENKNPEKHIQRKLETLKKDLNLSELPRHIECFDNSNIQGTNSVAACVVFKNARPSKADYRHYNIKTVEGADDYASMSEIVYRRYKRLIDEKKELPQLIIIDGGKGQLNAALKSLKKLNLENISIISIAEKLEEIYFPNDSVPLFLDKNSESLKLIQHARDEAHRFGLSFHRNKRSANFIVSELENIAGIGDKTIDVLLTKYKSVNQIKKAKIEDLETSIGKAKAKLLIDYFKIKQNSNE